VAGHDLARNRGPRLGVAQHRHLDLPPLDALLDDDPLVVGGGQRRGLVQLAGLVGLGHAHRRAEVGRLHEQRVGQALGRHRPLRPVDLGVAQGEVRALGYPVGPQHLLGLDLVHAQRRAEHAGPDVGHPGQLQQALHRAVLAEGAVQQRQHHHRQAAGGRGDRGQRLDGGAGGGDPGRQRRPPRGQGRERVLGADPGAVAGDPDRLDLVAAGVGRRQDVGGGRARHLVLGGPPPEQHDEPDAVR
jgi:hypothetical protein